MILSRVYLSSSSLLPRSTEKGETLLPFVTGENESGNGPPAICSILVLWYSEVWCKSYVIFLLGEALLDLSLLPEASKRAES